MDFDKIKPTVEEINLSEIQRQKIIEACKKQKKKSFNYKLWIPVAAAVFAVVIFSPGFFLIANNKAADMAAPESGNGFDYLADTYGGEINEEEVCVAVDDCITQGTISVQNQSSAISLKALFNSGVYREIYSVIPSQFAWLVDSEEYEKWKNSVDASGGMAMMQFVKHFNISREDFDSANEAYEAYINSTFGIAIKEKPANETEEKLEIFNADVIYSFDRETVNGYYLAEYK